MTKKEFYERMIEVLEGIDNLEDKEELISFNQKQLDLTNNKAERAKERAAEKRAEGDELRNTIKSVLTNEFQTVDEIFEKVEKEGVTRAKVISRIGQLVKNGDADKTEVKSGDRTLKAYRLSE